MAVRKELIEAAKRAIGAIGNDSTVPVEQTVEELEEILTDVDERLEALYEQIETSEKDLS